MYLVFYDTETSGLFPNKHEIIQIAAIAYEVVSGEWNALEEFEAKIQFDMANASQEALESNCYDASTWATEAIPSHNALIQFDAFIQKYKDVERISKRTNRPFYCARTAGHNIISFDDAFLRAWYKKHGNFCPVDYAAKLDTFQQAQWKVLEMNYQPPENYKLGTLCEYFGIQLDNAHDALADIRANASLSKHLASLRG